MNPRLVALGECVEQSMKTFISGQPESPLWGTDIEDNIKTPFRIFRDEKASQNMTTFRTHNLTPLVCDNYCQSSRCHVGACNTRGSPDPHVGCDNLAMYTTRVHRDLNSPDCGDGSVGTLGGSAAIPPP